MSKHKALCLAILFASNANSQQIEGSTVIIYSHDFGVFVGADSKVRRGDSELPYPVCKIHEVNGFIITHVGRFRTGGFSPVRIAKSIAKDNPDIATASIRLVKETVADLKNRLKTGDVVLPLDPGAEPFLRIFLVKPGADTVFSMCSFSVEVTDSLTYFSNTAEFVRWRDKNKSGVWGEYEAIIPILTNPNINPIEKAKTPKELATRIKELITIQSWFTPTLVGEPVYVVWLPKTGGVNWIEKEQDCTVVE